MFKTRRVQIIKCEFCAEWSSKSSLIFEMSSEFVWSSIFWVFKLSREFFEFFNFLSIQITALSARGRVEPPTKFWKRGGLTRPQLLEESFWERRGDFLQGVGRCNFHIKNELKSEIFHDKKSLWEKIFFSVITENSNW